MADINLHKIFEQLNTKMDRDGSNCAAPSAVIVDSYKNGSNWYRVWSDGWVEQGGSQNRATSGTVTFLVPLNSTDYNVHINCTSGTIRFAYATGRTATSFTFNAADDSSANNDGTFSWSVRGYKA